MSISLLLRYVIELHRINGAIFRRVLKFKFILFEYQNLCEYIFPLPKRFYYSGAQKEKDDAEYQEASKPDEVLYRGICRT